MFIVAMIHNNVGRKSSGIFQVILDEIKTQISEGKIFEDLVIPSLEGWAKIALQSWLSRKTLVTGTHLDDVH
jgi:hypothetical protein